MNYRLRIPDWVLLLACCSFFFLWQLSSFGLVGADEPRYAQVAREMLDRHDWVTPTLGGEAWLEKPPLYYWEAMLAYRFFGVSDWAARLPSAFDAAALVFAAYWFLRRFRPGFALDGALMLATSAAIVGFARAASTDMPLAATFGMAMLAWWAWFETGSRGWLAWFYGSLALATLAKGPVAPALAVLIIGIFAALQRSWLVLGRSLWLPGVLLFCVVSLPWYVLVQLRNPQFFRVFILEHNLARFGTNLFHHPEPFWYYIPVAVLGWLPWAVFVVFALYWVIRRVRAGADSLDIFLLIWVVVIVAFFSVSRSKLPGYILPAFAPGVLVLTNYLKQAASSGVRPLLAILHGICGGGLVSASLVLRYVLLQHKLEWTSALVMPGVATFAIACLIAVLLIKAGVRALRVATLVPAIIALAIAIRFGASAVNEMQSARAVSDALARVSPRHLPVAGVLISREVEFGLEFYRNQPIPRYELKQAPPVEHLVVARAGFQRAFARDIPGRNITKLGDYPEQKLEFFYVAAQPSALAQP